MALTSSDSDGGGDRTGLGDRSSIAFWRCRVSDELELLELLSSGKNRETLSGPGNITKLFSKSTG